MVTIIIPTYNSKKYISQAIKSILNQSYKDYEIIVVDDGSTDGTCEELKKYERRIKYYYKKNGGVASARNYGILKSKGEYICFLDADDIYEKNKLEEQIKILKNNPEADVVYSDIDIVDEELNYINTLKSEGIYKCRRDFLAIMLVRQIIPGPASIMIRRKCIESGVKYNEKYKYAEDYDFTLRLAQRFNYIYIPKSLYFYRRHEGNLTNNHKKQFDNEVEIVQNIGVRNLKDIVWKSSFDELTKMLIYSKILIKIYKWKKAVSILLEIASSKKSASVYFYLGNCYFHLKDYELAEECYIRAINLDNFLAEVYSNLGCAYANMGKLDLAICNFKKALETRPNYMDASLNLNNLRGNKLNVKLTEKELRKTLTLYDKGDKIE